jgi:hypothetical protein
MNPFHALTSYFSKGYFNTIFQSRSRSSTWSVSFRFSYRSPVLISHLSRFPVNASKCEAGCGILQHVDFGGGELLDLAPPPQFGSPPLVAVHNHLFCIHLPYLEAVCYILNLRTPRCEVTGTHLPRTIFTHGSRLTHAATKARCTA